MSQQPSDALHDPTTSDGGLGISDYPTPHTDRQSTVDYALTVNGREMTVTDAWIGESLGVEYYCQTCIDRLQAESMGQQPDPTTARYSELLQAMTPGAPPLAAAPQQPSTPRATELPPKPERPRVRRRYRRIDL